MGVERFFSSLKRDYNFIKDVNKKIECEHILIDFNSIVHVSSQFLLEKVKKDQSMTSEIFETMLLEKVGNYILDMLNNNFYPRNLITINICVDGVPSMSKIFEQKKRRYMGDLLTNLNSHPSTFSWSRNNISPGTDFMNKMMKYLKSSNYEDKIHNICHNLKYYNVSGIDVVGEGEMKILHLISSMSKTKYKNDRYVVYSPDSDVIIILLMTNINVMMLRYDQQQSTDMMPVYSMIDIDMFKTILYDYVKDKINKKLDKNRIIMDMVFIMTVFGDDFLPKLETIRVNTDINIILDHYVMTLLRYGHICFQENNTWEIDADNFYYFLSLLEKKEKYFLKRNARYHVSTNYHKIVSDIIGFQMYKLRDLIVEYLWKFIYFNKPSDIKVTPVNAHIHIPVEKLREFMADPEPSMNMRKFTHMEMDHMKVWSMMHNIISDYYIEIIMHINIKDYVLLLPSDLLKEIIEHFYYTYTIPIKVPLKDSHPKILYVSFNSTDIPHKYRLEKLPDIERELYKIDNKLDKYYKMMNPIDTFYEDYYKNNNIKNYYKIHLPHTKPAKIVSDYIVGLNWVMNYYFNSDATYKNVDMSWYYPHNRSPLLADIILTFDKKLLSQRITNPFTTYMTPLEHYIYVSPFHYEKDIHEQVVKYLGSHSTKTINNIVMFIKKYKKYYYDLDHIYKDLKNKKYIDCSGSIFISKCHLLFMENYIDMNEYINDIRLYVVCASQKCVYSSGIAHF